MKKIRQRGFLIGVIIVTCLAAGIAFATTVAESSAKAENTSAGGSLSASPEMSPTEIAREAADKPPTHEVGPTGPEISPVEAQEAAMSDAHIVANDSRPELTAIAMGTVGTAQVALEHGAGQAAPFGGKGSMPWSSFSAYLVVLHGTFSLNVSVPRGRQSPKGSVLGLIVDAHTGMVEGRYLGETVPNVAEVGQVMIG